MTEQPKMTTVCTQYRTSPSTVRTDHTVHAMPSADYSSIITMAVAVHLSDQYDNRLYISGMIGCLKLLCLLGDFVMFAVASQ